MRKNLNVFRRDKSILMDKIKESFSSVIPISLIVLFLCFTITPIKSDVLLSFIIGTFFVVVGMGLFSLGADVAMTPIGEYVGESTIKSKKIWIIIPVFFFLGVIITISEPDLSVLAAQLANTINSWTLIISVGVGVVTT